MRNCWLVGVLALLSALGSACSDSQPAAPAELAQAATLSPTVTPAAGTDPTRVPTSTPIPVPTDTRTPTPEPTHTPAPTAEPTATLTATPTPTPAALNPAQIFEQVSPSVAFVETSAGTGSGVLIESGYVVTNAHVVWPFDRVRVVFPDGSEFTDAPVLAWDLMGDLAVIGPLQTDVRPMVLVGREDLGVASTVFLIGYPGAPGESPEPTISSGLISRLREWEAIEMTYFQTDISIAGGQSGGVLVSGEGEVIGISGFFITEALFGLAASAADIMPRVQGLIAGEDVAGLGAGRVPLGRGLRFKDLSRSLRNHWDKQVYVLEVTKGTEVNIETTQLEAPYFVLNYPTSDEGVFSGVTSSHALGGFTDPDDGKGISVGQTLSGSMDYPSDTDYFLIELQEGQTIEITVDSLNIDPVFAIDFRGATDDQIMSDDDSGGGVFGLNAKLTYKAPHAGEYRIALQDSPFVQVGGYFLTVAEAPPGAVAVSPPVAPERAVVQSPFGPMAVYESRQYPFSIQYPAAWTEQAATPELGILAAFANEDEVQFLITVEDLGHLGVGKLTLAEYVDGVISAVSSEGVEVVPGDETTTLQGGILQVLELTLLGGAVTGRRLVYVHNGTLGFSATYLGARARFEELAPLIEYSLGTFRVWDPDTKAQDPVFHYDQGIDRLWSGEYQESIDAFTKAIELGPGLAEAYVQRSTAYEILGEFDNALADLTMAIDIRPDDPDLYVGRCGLHWLLSDQSRALGDCDRAVQLDDTNASAYNTRAFIHTALSNFDDALADANKALQLEPGAASILDTRGYVYLKSGDYERAKLDYEAILEQGIKGPLYALRGGLVYAYLGESDRAVPLLERGLEEAETVDFLDPQLADLIAMAEEALADLR